jgi:CheY-like chemotaxis protein
MQIVCPACQKRLQIADDKLPSDRQVRLTCPACQERFPYDPSEHKTAAAEVSHAPAGAATPPETTSRATSTSAMGTIIDITEAGPAPRGLICVDNPSHREACQGMLPTLGFHTIHTPSHQAQALAYLSQVPYECFILDVTFDSSTLEANPVLACLHELPMDRRRYMFTMLCVPPGTLTTDAMTAYSQSVNLLVDQSDLPSCRRLLEQHFTAHKRLYRVYRELRQQLGKDI